MLDEMWQIMLHATFNLRQKQDTVKPVLSSLSEINKTKV